MIPRMSTSRIRMVAGTECPSVDGNRPIVERAPRTAVLLSGFIRRAGSRNRMPITIRNISTGGLMAECAYPPRIDEKVEIELRQLGIVAGKVRWGQGGRIGIEFEGPIDPALVMNKQQRSPVLFEMPAMDTRRPGVVSAH
jgi:hypothetical protein